MASDRRPRIMRALSATGRVLARAVAVFLTVLMPAQPNGTPIIPADPARPRPDEYRP